MNQPTAWRRATSLLTTLALTLMGAPTLAYADDGPTAFTVDGITFAVTGEGEVSVGTGTVGEQAISTSWSGALEIPETVACGSTTYRVTSIAAYACTTCTSLTEVSIPASVTSIGYNAFGYCGTMDDSGATPTYGGLSTITIAKGSQLAIIDENAFIKDYALHAFTFPAAVESIGRRAFQDCFSFEYFACEEGSQLRGIAAHAFSATLPAMDPDTTPSSGKGPGAFKSRSDEEEAVKAYTHLKRVSLPAALKTLGEGAFENQRALTELSWDDACEMTIIGDGSFQYCTALEEASVPAVTFAPEGLGPYSFQYCVSLKTFTYKGVIRAPYSGYSERGLFRGDTNLETVIYLADKYHQPHGTLTVIDTGRQTFTDCDPTVYYLLTFYASSADAANGADPVGSAVVREGTPYADLTASLPTSDEQGTVIYSGAIPALEEGYGWVSSEGGGAVGVTNAVAVYPMQAGNLAGGGIALSQTSFDYTAAACQPEVTVKDATGTVLAEGQYTLRWERKGDNGTWSATDDLTSPGSLRVSACAASGSGYTGETAPAEFTISALATGATFQAEGITYTALTTSTSNNPTVMVGDGKTPAVDVETTGSVTIPGNVCPPGSTIPYAVTRIGSYAFGGADATSGCNGISSVTIEEGVTTVDSSAFKYAQALETVSLPASLTAIGASAFANCPSLTTVTFAGNTLESVGLRAFSNCQSLESITLPAITGNLNSFAFENCLSLSNVVFTGDVITGFSNQFQGCDYLETVLFCGNNPGFALSENATCYARVQFEDGAHNPLGTADVAVGTALASITSALPSGSLLSGAIPALPTGTAWSFALTGSALTQATTATAVVPAVTTPNKPVTRVTKAGVTYKVSGKVAQVTKVAKSKKSVTIAKTVKIGSKTYKVSKVKAKVFKGTKVTKVTVKSTTLTKKSVKNSLKGSKVKTVKAPKAKRAAYTKIFKKANSGKKVTVK